MNSNENELTLYVCAWGDKHLHYLERLALPSVFQKNNLPSCGYHKFHVRGATVGNRQQLVESIERGIGSGGHAEIHATDYGSGIAATGNGLRDAIGFAIETKTRLLMVPPDTLFGDYSILNMVLYARNKSVTVACPHLRVNEDTFLSHFNGLAYPFPIKNSELVNEAMYHGHQSLKASFCDQDNGTEHGGISLRQLAYRTWSCIHYLPTPYLCWFTESDRRFFEHRDCLGDWDHVWTSFLASEGRLRVFGSSELFFAVELTPRESNGVNVKPGSAFEEHSVQGISFLRCLVGGLFG